MIEIKKPIASGINFITVYKDLINDNVDFHLLNLTPYLVLSAIPGNKCIVPVNLVIDYYSIGNNSLPGRFNLGSLNAIPYNSGSAMFKFLSSVNNDQSGIITTNINSDSQQCATNQILNDNVVLWCNYNDPTLNFNRFRIYFTYYLLDLI